jgi:hypothetical protein
VQNSCAKIALHEGGQSCGFLERAPEPAWVAAHITPDDLTIESSGRLATAPATSSSFGSV